jgi:hypothetical protein
VDVSLRATLPYGSITPMPTPEMWRSLSDSVEVALDEALPRADVDQGQRLLPAVSGWRGDLEVEARCTEDGELSLEGVSVSAFRLVPVPRMWDDPEKREKEQDAGEHLVELADRIKVAMDEWRGAVAELARWIRYTPPPQERMVDSLADTEDDEPETVH